MSSLTFAIVLWTSRRSDFWSAESAVISKAVFAGFWLYSYTKFHTRPKKRFAPSTPDSCHSSVISAGDANIMKRRTVSAPYFSTISCGSIPLFFDFDILVIPVCTNSRPSGSVALMIRPFSSRSRVTCIGLTQIRSLVGLV